MWTVIIFIKDNTIEVVLVKWLIGENEELCYWPPKGNIKSLIINSVYNYNIICMKYSEGFPSAQVIFEL